MRTALRLNPELDPRDQALRSLRAATTRSIFYHRQACLTGAIDGSRFDTCHFGILAQGDGHDFRGKTQDEIAHEVCAYAKTLGIDIYPHGPMSPIESFCKGIGRGDTPATSILVEALLEFDNLVLAERERAGVIVDEVLRTQIDVGLQIARAVSEGQPELVGV